MPNALLRFGFSVLTLCAVAAQAHSQNCSSYGSISPSYLTDCQLRVNVGITSNFNNCGAPLPGHLVLRVYRDSPSAQGGVLVGSNTSPCDWYWPIWSSTFGLSGVPSSTTVLWIEAWIDPGSSAPIVPCSNWQPIAVPYLTNADTDLDGVSDCIDNCPSFANPDQQDSDGDGLGDLCDNCPWAFNPGQEDTNGNGVPDACEPQVGQGRMLSATNRVYYRSLDTVTHAEAEAIAESLGGYLVAINDIAEMSDLLTAFGSTELYWIGLERTGPGDTFEWVSNEPLSYSNWCPSEPNGAQFEEDFVVMNWHLASSGAPTGCWNDVSGNPGTDVFRALIEVPPPAQQSTCFGDGSVIPCPCGNNAAIGSQSGCSNQTGAGATLVVGGVTSVSIDQLELSLTGAPAMSFAVLASANNLLPSSSPGMGIAAFDGLRCIGGGFRRHGSRATDAAGGTVNPWGASGGLISQSNFSEGQTRHFQAFYRDTADATCGTGQNTSQAVSVIFLP